MSGYRFLRLNVTIVTVALLVAGVAGSCVAQGANAPGGAFLRPFAPDRYALFLGGSFADLLQDAGGGAISANVLEVREGDSCTSAKHITGPEYEDFDVLAFIPPAGPVFDWVRASFTCQPTRSDGAVADLGSNGGVIWSKEFFHALISEVTIPACDASSRDPSYLSLKFSPEVIRRLATAGPVQFGRGQKLWMPSNFRLEIAGLDTSSVTRIESLVVTRQIVEVRDGTSDTVRKMPGNLVIPNVVVTLPLSKAASWIAWHEDFVVKGNSSPTNEKEGVLTLLAPDRSPLLRILLHHLGIIQVEPAPSGSGAAPNVKLATAVMYCDSMEFLPPTAP